jgi:hypothetical protein
MATATGSALRPSPHRTRPSDGLGRPASVARPNAPQTALQPSDLDRLGRETLETGMLLKQLSLAGVGVFSGRTGRSAWIPPPICW